MAERERRLSVISSLLRIQGRRLENEEAKLAIEESGRHLGVLSVSDIFRSSGGGAKETWSESM